MDQAIFLEILDELNRLGIEFVSFREQIKKLVGSPLRPRKPLPAGPISLTGIDPKIVRWPAKSLCGISHQGLGEREKRS